MAKNRVYLNLFYSGCMACVLFSGCKAKKADSAQPVKTAYYHNYGVEVSDEQDWVDRGASGQVVKSLKNGVVVKEQYRDSLLQGVTTATFPHSDTIKRITNYDKGILISEIDNYVSGSPAVKKQFLPDGQIFCIAWYEDGTPRAREEYRGELLVKGDYFTHDTHPEAHVVDGVGLRMNRDGQGNMISKDTISKGEVILSETYHQNGVVKERIPFVNGKIEGTKKVFLIGGEPDRFEEWKAGVLDGMVQLFQNGAKCAEVPYVQGEKQGVELRYKPGTTTVVEEISWVRDRRNGPSVVTIDEEQVTEWYYDGRKTSKSQYLEMMSRSFPNER